MNKKGLDKKSLALLLSAILVISMMAAIASASDWPQFQKDEVNIGRTNDNAPITYWNEKVLWNKYTYSSGWAGIDVTPLVVGDLVYVVAANNSVWAFNKTTGVVEWKNSTSGGWVLGNPAYGNNRIFVPTYNGRIYAINATTGNIDWWDDVNDADNNNQLLTPITYYKDPSENFGRLFFGDGYTPGANNYYCYNASAPTVGNQEQNSAKIWGYTGAGSNYWAGCAVIGDYIVFGNDSGYLTSLNWTNNGAYVDSLHVGGEIRSSVAWNVSAGNANYGHIFFTNRTGYNLSKIGFNKSTGGSYEGHFNSSDWDSYNIRYSTSTPAVYNGRVYVGGGNFSTGDNALLCLSESDLTKIWEYLPNGAVQSSPALSIQGSDVHIYFTTNNRYGTCYCIKDGGNSWEEKWAYTTEQAGPATYGASGGYILQGVAISDNWIYFGNDGGYLYGINKTEHVYDFCVGAGGEDGAEKKWAYGKQTTGNPPAACNDPNTVFSTTGQPSEYDRIKINDGVFKSDVTAANDNYAAHRFNFTILESTASISKINVTWNGKGYHDSGGTYNGAKLRIYNFNSGAYEQLNTTDSGDEVTLTGGVTSGISNYINAGNVTILVKQKSADAGRDDSHIETDYVKVLITT